MKLLLDTHVLIWALSTPERIKPKVQDLLTNVDNIVLVSVASLWELFTPGRAEIFMER